MGSWVPRSVTSPLKLEIFKDYQPLYLDSITQSGLTMNGLTAGVKQSLLNVQQTDHKAEPAQNTQKASTSKIATQR